MRKLFLFFLICALAPVVLAVGGGGGGGYFSFVDCDDSGKIQFSMSPQQDIVARRLRDSQVIAVPGTWSGQTFVSEEALFMDADSYEIVNGEGRTQQFTCPPFVFSCKLLKVQALSCIRNESGTYADITVINGNAADLKYSYNIKQRTFGGPRILFHTKELSSGELRDLQVREKDKVTFQVYVLQKIMADEFEVSHPACVGKQYRYSQVACTEAPTEVKPVRGEELKCGGYLDIEDRVRCRIRLRVEQKNEYENFFPEECITRDDKQACLKTYQAVQGCWQFPNGEPRIGCAKKQLNLGDVAQEKARCAQMPEQADCLVALRIKVYDLVKFRLYNLEEQAEEMLDKGLLEENAVVDLVIAVERIKREFNAATTKEQLKALVVQARAEWIKLMRTVRQ
ncbi:hypothetical protein HY642_02035 [Candidatus Woesearchaeota archaeon]|nr:hypothetical protein [Candidatus Woesearchaeota archaeon]